MTTSETMKELIKFAQENFTLSSQNIYLQKEFAKYYCYEMTTLQKKLIFFALASLTNEDRDLTAKELSEKKISIRVRDFIKINRLNESISYERIKDEILNLQKKLVKFKSAFDVEHYISFFSSTSYYSRESMKSINKEFNTNYDENTYIVFQLTKEIAECLIEFSKSNQYVSYNYMISHSFDFKYSIRVYELLQTRKDTNTVIFNLEEFYNYLALSASYRTKAQLRAKILKKVQEEFLEKFDLKLEYAIEGKGKDQKIILIADKNDNDLMKEIFDSSQLSIIEKAKKQMLEQAEIKKEQRKKSQLVY